MSIQKADMTQLPSLPSLRFDNRTEFDALHFDTIDHNDVGFHVIVAKTGYHLDQCNEAGFARLQPLDAPALLVTEDRFHEDRVECSVRVESDLAPYKPKCDVVVLGDAYAPGGRPAESFQVSLQMKLQDQPAPLPEPPQPLNPFQPLSMSARQAWQAELAAARAMRIPGRVLIDKTLTVTGPRELRREGMLFPCWHLTDPVPVASVPLRYEHAQGGECIVDGTSDGANEVPQQQRLTDEQQSQYKHLGAPPVAHVACQYNPVGRGFAPEWYLKATRTSRLPAPQFEYLHAQFSTQKFEHCSRGKAELVPAGLGFVGRAWLPRRELIGTFDTTKSWQRDDVPRLPRDFDFAYWNGAPLDQQVDYPSGGEQFTLLNLAPPEAPFVRNGVLNFKLPCEQLFLLAVDDDNAVAATPLSIDTIVIDTAAGRVELTWRLCLIADGRFADAQLLHASTAEQLNRLEQWNVPEDAGEPAANA